MKDLFSAKANWAISIPFIFFNLLGCIHMTYEAPGPPDEEIAILEYNWMHSFYLWRIDTLKVTHIDDVEIPPWSDVALLPGSHRISFAYEEMAQGLIPFIGTVPIWLFVKSGDLILEAEAGHTYKLCIEKEDEVFYSWIYDVDTEQVVAGEPPESETEIVALPSEEGSARPRTIEVASLGELNRF